MENALTELTGHPGPYCCARDNPQITYVRPEDSRLRCILVDAMERVFGRRKLQRIYDQIKTQEFDLKRFFSPALESPGIHVDHARKCERLIPRAGPLIFVANHPFGVIDGAIPCALTARTRGRFRILIHACSGGTPTWASCFLPVDFDATPAALESNIRTRRAALDTLNTGGARLIYPSGGVSTASGTAFGRVRDPPWTTFTAKLVPQSRATVVPVFVHASNSRLFHVLSYVNSTLRTGLLLRVARRQFGRTIRMEIGDPVGYETVAHPASRHELTEYPHRRTWDLERAGAATLSRDRVIRRSFPLPRQGIQSRSRRRSEACRRI